MRALKIASLAAVLGSLVFIPHAKAQVSSPTWSGYMVENGGTSTISYTEAGVSFALPGVACPNTGLGAAGGVSFWVGLDSGGTSPIEKAGIMVTCDNTPNPPQPVYQAFWLMSVPGQPADVHFGFTAQPGDGIHAGVTYANGSFQLVVTDGSQSFSSGPQPCVAPGGCPRASVEWIVERPGDDVPLAAYGCVPSACVNQSPPPPGIVLSDPVMFTPNATYAGPSQGFLRVISMYERGPSGAANGPPLSGCLAAPSKQPIRTPQEQGTGRVFTTLSGSFLCQWSGYGIAACDPSGCISEQTFCENIVKNFYNSNTGQTFVMGYAVLCGSMPPYFGGVARLVPPADGGSLAMPSADLNINIASVTKTMTAILALKVLGYNNLPIDTPIWNYLPTSWQQAIGTNNPNCKPLDCPVAKITFSALLQQKSGLCGADNTVDAACTRTPVPASNNLCGGDDTMDSVLTQLLQSVVEPKPTWHYDNCNFALFRVLLPQMPMTGDPCIYNWTKTCSSSPPTAAQSAQLAANFYVSQMNQYVFTPLGLPTIGCKPTSAPTSMYSYPFPVPNSAFSDPPTASWNGAEENSSKGDWTLSCGGGGLNMSAQDIFAALNNLANGTILLTPAQKAEMKANFLGWDNYLRASGPPDACPGYVCKNGNIPGGNGTPYGWTTDNYQIWTYAGIVKCTVPVAIIVNSPLPPYYQPFPLVPAPPNAPGSDTIGLVNDALNATPNILAPKACPAGSFE
jgi:CubicO group peptidase (beta-lactamase class C family)